MNNSRTNNSLSENISKSFIQETQPLDIIKGYRDSSAILEKLEENLEKGLISDEEFEKALSTLDIISKGGEGSKGGKVIGHTKSGKPIYDTANHASHANFTYQDHKDAAKHHLKTGNALYAKQRKEVDDAKQEDETHSQASSRVINDNGNEWNRLERVKQHHYTQESSHKNSAKKMMSDHIKKI